MTKEEFFSRYKYDRTKDRIDGGGFGNVYKVFDTIENETVALKIKEVNYYNNRTNYFFTISNGNSKLYLNISITE